MTGLEARISTCLFLSYINYEATYYTEGKNGTGVLDPVLNSLYYSTFCSSKMGY